MKYWLVKTEASVYSIDDFKKDKKTDWHGVRNYQARNFLKDMQIGDKVLFYHSVEEPVGVAGLAEVVNTAYPDKSQFDSKSEYFDEKSMQDNPRWFSPDLRFVEKFVNVVCLKELKKDKKLKDMHLFKKGSRLSVQPVLEKEFRAILEMAGSK